MISNFPAVGAKDQRGFTLIEIMVALTIGLFLISGILGIMYQSAGMADSMQGRLLLNQEARELFRIAYNGGIGANGSGVPGLRGHSKASAPTAVSRVNGRLNLIGGTAGDITSRRVNAISVLCQGAGSPLEECTGTETRQTQGLLARSLSSANNTLVQPAGANERWSIVTFDLIDPRLAGSKLSGQQQYLDTFYTIISHSKEN